METLVQQSASQTPKKSRADEGSDVIDASSAPSNIGISRVPKREGYLVSVSSICVSMSALVHSIP